MESIYKSIDVGTMVQETNNGNVVLYRCTIAIKEPILKANDGKTVRTIKSMPVVACIVYEKETYLNWLLDMLSFTNYI